ncbi:MAG: MaoC/PaaZ C-terminal domain-containing protein [Candidatus Binatia bacterium]
MPLTNFFPAGEVHVGQDLGGRTVTVNADEIARYRAGTGAPELADDPAPALLFHSEVYRDLSWYLPNLIGNLHARQEWQVFHPMRVGDVVRSRATVVERYRKRDRLYVVNEVLWTDGDGRWLQRSRTHQSFLADDPVAAIVVDKAREHRTDRRFVVPEGDGADLPRHPRRITPAMCMAFSGPSLNYHTDREAAQAFGFPDIVVQGMMSVCFVADGMGARFGRGWWHGGALDVRLVNVVWANDEITARGAVREVVAEGSRRRVVLDVWCTKADGTIAIIGTASALE